ncbi:hypothetical protein DMH25_07535 [Streptomyces sp. WAC 01325]|nr:hypothetical protein DMH25_07535 [Streptomyces sp. WAC 01325]
MPLVTKWTGREVKALREAVRMSLMEFAEKLGVSDRIVSRWEADGEQASLHMKLPLGSDAGSGDRFGHAAWRAGVVMTVSYSMGVSRPSEACLRRRW